MSVYGITVLRAVVVYLTLIVMMKLLGKRQVGELQISELVTTLLLSEIATQPIENPESDLLQPFLALSVILLLEFLISLLLLKLPAVRALIESKPNRLIRNGKPDLKEMGKARITLDEVLSELRLLGINEPEQVHTATLESSGRLSVELKSAYRPLTPDDLGIPKKEDGACHIVLLLGKTDPEELQKAGKDERWLSAFLSEKKLTEKEVLLLTVTDGGRIFFLKNEKKIREN